LRRFQKCNPLVASVRLYQFFALNTHHQHQLIQFGPSRVEAGRCVLGAESVDITWFFEFRKFDESRFYRQQKRLIFCFGTLSTNRPEKMQPPPLPREKVSGRHAKV